MESSKTMAEVNLGDASLDQLLEFADYHAEEDGQRALAQILWCRLSRKGFVECVAQDGEDIEIVNLDEVADLLNESGSLVYEFGHGVTNFMKDFLKDRSELLDVPLDNRGEI